MRGMSVSRWLLPALVSVAVLLWSYLSQPSVKSAGSNDRQQDVSSSEAGLTYQYRGKINDAPDISLGNTPVGFAPLSEDTPTLIDDWRHASEPDPGEAQAGKSPHISTLLSSAKLYTQNEGPAPR
jgi:hypothetical protein